MLRLVFLPLAVLALCAAGLFLFLPRAADDPREGRSTLSRAPDFSLPALPAIGASGLARADLEQGQVSLVNVWASWCAPCRLEHPFLIRLRDEGEIQMTGIAYKDSPENAARFLSRFGNPFRKLGVDQTGAAALNWGIYGVPETFILDGQGRIVLRHFGPITQESFERQLRPALARARAATR